MKAAASAVFLLLLASAVRAETEEGIVYGEAGGQQLTMDYYPPKGPGPHPVVIIIHGGGFVGGTSKNGSVCLLGGLPGPRGLRGILIHLPAGSEVSLPRHDRGRRARGALHPP